MEERFVMRLEVMGAELLGKINENFRKKVQLKEQIEENEVQIHFHRGVLWGINKCQEIAKEILKGTQIETMYENNHPKEIEKVEVK